jgi:hypothetical protein
MDDFNKPIRPLKKEEKERIKIDPISHQLDQEEKLSMQRRENEENKGALFTYLSLMKKIFGFFKGNKESSLLEEHQETLEKLKKLKEQLRKIGEENPSEDLLFCKNLASIWQDLISTQKNHAHSKIDQLIDAISSYPNPKQTCLGFYLENFSEKEWFPLPFFDLLKELHLDYFENQKNSDLDRWISLIDEILEENF